MTPRPTARLQLTRLEDRTTPTSIPPMLPITVTTAADVVDPNDGVISLREAIDEAQLKANVYDSPAIRFAPELARATITVSQVGGTTLGPAAFEITEHVRIVGTGQKIIRAGDAPNMRLFSVIGDLPYDGSTELGLNTVEVLNWRSDGFGGAIYSRNALVRISTSTLAGNSAETLGGAVYAVGGWVDVTTSTFTGNTARPDASGYSAGGAILVGPSDTAGGLSLIASTLADNTAASGAQVFAAGTTGVMIDQCILYSNSTAGLGYDLVVQAPATTLGYRGDRNLIGSSFGYTGGVVGSVDPLLGPLQDNGGPTRTMALLPGSPAIDAGRVWTDSVPRRVDQRGAARDDIDLGAFEFGATVPPPNSPPVWLTTGPVPLFAVATGAAAGQPPEVVVYNLNGDVVKRFLAYGANFRGGVNVTLADVTGDGVFDVVTAAGPGGGPHVKVFDGVTFEEVRSFYAYDPTFAGGVSLATGDVTGDGVPDIVTGAGAGGGPHVKAFDGRTGAVVRNFYAYDANFRGGVNVAVMPVEMSSVGDVTRTAQIVTGAGAGGGPHVKAFDAGSLREVQSFFAYDAGFSGGVSVAVNGGGNIFTGAGPGGGPHLKVFVQNELDRRGGSGVTEEVSMFTGTADDIGGVVVSVDTSDRPRALTRTADGLVAATKYWPRYTWGPTHEWLTFTLEVDSDPGNFPKDFGAIGSIGGRTGRFVPYLPSQL